jgi:hypothetical protein
LSRKDSGNVSDCGGIIEHQSLWHPVFAGPGAKHADQWFGVVGKDLVAIFESGVNDAALMQPVPILVAVVLDAACSRLVQAGVQDNLFIAFYGHNLESTFMGMVLCRWQCTLQKRLAVCAAVASTWPSLRAVGPGYRLAGFRGDVFSGDQRIKYKSSKIHIKQ